jgi:hypothetical protein
MKDQQQLLSPLECKNLGNHLLRHIREAHGPLHRDLCFANTQQVLLLVLNQRDRYQYECACAHLATAIEKPAK